MTQELADQLYQIIEPWGSIAVCIPVAGLQKSFVIDPISFYDFEKLPDYIREILVYDERGEFKQRIIIDIQNGIAKDVTHDI